MPETYYCAGVLASLVRMIWTWQLSYVMAPQRYWGPSPSNKFEKVCPQGESAIWVARCLHGVTVFLCLCLCLCLCVCVSVSVAASVSLSFSRCLSLITLVRLTLTTSTKSAPTHEPTPVGASYGTSLASELNNEFTTCIPPPPLTPPTQCTR